MGQNLIPFSNFLRPFLSHFFFGHLYDGFCTTESLHGHFEWPFLFDHFCTTIFVWPFLRLVSYEPLSVSWHYELTKIRILSVLILSLRLKSCVYNWDRRRFFILSSLKTGVEYLSERVELIDWISMVIIKISSSSIHNQLKPNFSLLDVKYILFIFHFFKSESNL